MTIVVEEPYAPLHAGTTAVHAETSLSGVANRYVQLSPGVDSNPELPENAVIPIDQDHDDRRPRPVLQHARPQDERGPAQHDPRVRHLVRAAAGYEGNAVAKYFAPSLSATRSVLERLSADQPALKALVRDTSRWSRRSASAAATLTDLVTNTNTTMGAIADENEALAEALDYLPQTLRRGSTTFVDLRATLDDLDKLVAASKPASKNLAPFLADLRPLLTGGHAHGRAAREAAAPAGRRQRLHGPAEQLARPREGGVHRPSRRRSRR